MPVQKDSLPHPHDLKTGQLTVGFAWQTSSSENLGVGALAESNLAIARSAAARADVELRCMEFCPTGPGLDRTKELRCEVSDPLSIKGMLLGRSKFHRQIAACDVLLDIGAGDSFSDIYGKKHFGFLALTKYLALRHGVPLILSPQTMGPFEAPLVRHSAQWLIRRSFRVYARDHQSMDYLRELGCDANAKELIDVAFRLPYQQAARGAGPRVKVGINVSGLLFNGGYTRDNQFGLRADYPAAIEGLLQRLCARTDLEVHLVGHVISDSFEVEDDLRVCRQLHLKFPNTIVAPRFDTPVEAKSYISGLDFFTGARMHACIGAFSSGVPVVPMAYSRKFNGLFGSLGYHEIADLKADDTNTVIDKVLQGLERRQGLAEQVARGNEMAQAKLSVYEDDLVELFRSLSGRTH